MLFCLFLFVIVTHSNWCRTTPTSTGSISAILSSTSITHGHFSVHHSSCCPILFCFSNSVCRVAVNLVALIVREMMTSVSILCYVNMPMQNILQFIQLKKLKPYANMPM